MAWGQILLTAILLAFWPITPAFAEELPPLSAIDWLSNSVTTVDGSQGGGALGTQVLAAPLIAVTRLEFYKHDGLGLLPPRITGLPQYLWGSGFSSDIKNLIAQVKKPNLPAAQSFFIQLLLAETSAPHDSTGEATLLTARIDRLLEMGALEQAEGLINLVPVKSPALFRRSFDMALLTGHEEMACQTMRAAPMLAPTYMARIFCLARDGDWAAAAITLRASQGLGLLSAEQDAILNRFLDADLTDLDLPLSTPSRPSPLIWRLFEAIGEPLATQSLPLAFAHADLRIQSGYKAQLEAAERLAKAGVLSPNLLLGLYSDGAPATSGGVWDRVAAFQKFESAITNKNTDEIAQQLPIFWSQMKIAGLEVPFANIYARRLASFTLPEPTATLAFHVMLLSDAAAQIAQLRIPQSEFEALLIAIATGTINQDPFLLEQPSFLPKKTPATVSETQSLTIFQKAVGGAFSRPILTDDLQSLVDQSRTGEAILRALDLIYRGANGDSAALRTGISLFYLIGQQDTARQIALQALLLERRS